MNTGRLAVITAFLAALAVVCGGLPAQAQSDASADDEIQILSLDQSDPDLVELTVAIPPSIRETAPTRDSFALTLDGAPREIQVGLTRDTVDVVLLIDTSGSMAGNAIRSARDAALDFVDRLPSQASIGVVGFGAETAVLASVGSERTDIVEAIGSLQAVGETALWDGLIQAAEQLPESSGSAFIIVLSDGADTVSNATRQEAIERLTEGGASLYAVALETSEGDGADLAGVATEVGGQFLVTDQVEGLTDLYGQIAERLLSRYVVRFDAPAEAEGRVVLSVAGTDGGLAIARTNLEDTSAAGESATSGAVPSSLETAALPAELGSLVAPDPSLLQQPWVLTGGAALIFLAIAILAMLVSMPSLRVVGLRAPTTADAGNKISGIQDRLSQTAQRVIDERDPESTLDRSLEAAGLHIRPGEFVVVMMTGLVVLALLGSALGGLVGAAILAGGGAGLVLLLLQIRISRRRDAFADQLLDTLTVIIGSLRAGRGLPQALELVSQELPSPSADEFGRVVVEARIGRDQIESLESMADRMQNDDLRWIAQAIAINRELGGDLIEVLENVANTIRDRVRLHRHVRALSAEGRMSGWVLVALPILMFVYLRLVNPAYARLLTERSEGIAALLFGVFSMLVGGIWIRKLVNLKY